MAGDIRNEVQQTINKRLHFYDLYLYFEEPARKNIALIERFKRKRDEEFNNELMSRKGKRTAELEKQDSQWFEDNRYLEGLIKELQSYILLRRAARLGLPLPDHDQWVSNPDHPDISWLPLDELMKLKNAIRAELKARWEMRLLWFPYIMGVGGLLVAILALLKK